MWMSPLSLCKNSKQARIVLFPSSSTKKEDKRRENCIVFCDFCGVKEKENTCIFLCFLFRGLLWVATWDMDMDERTCMRACGAFYVTFSPLFFSDSCSLLEAEGSFGGWWAWRIEILGGWEGSGYEHHVCFSAYLRPEKLRREVKATVYILFNCLDNTYAWLFFERDPILVCGGCECDMWNFCVESFLEFILLGLLF